MEERRQTDAVIVRFIDENERAHDQLRDKLDGLEERSDDMHKQNEQRIERIEQALFDEHGRSRLARVLAILEAGDFGASFFRWAVVVGGALLGAWAAFKGMK